MNLVEKIDLLANISILLDAQEKLGIQRSTRLARLFQRHWDDLKKELEEDEARQSADSAVGPQAGTGRESGESGWSGSTRPESWPRQGGGTIIQG